MRTRDRYELSEAFWLARRMEDMDAWTFWKERMTDGERSQFRNWLDFLEWDRNLKALLDATD